MREKLVSNEVDAGDRNRL